MVTHLFLTITLSDRYCYAIPILKGFKTEVHIANSQTAQLIISLNDTVI